MKIKLKELTPDPKNTRRHDMRNIKTIKESLIKFGQFRDFVVQKKGMIIRVGNGMYQAMKDLGWEEAEAKILDLSDKEATELSILDNRSSELATWDNEVLAEILKSYDTEEQEFVGFNEKDIEKLMASTGNAPEDKDAAPRIDQAKELNKTWQVKTGDIFQIGRHRLACGDSTDPETVAALLNGATPGIMVTDPQYGVEYDANWRNESDRANGKPYGARAIGKVINDNRCDWCEAWALFPGNVAYVWHADLQSWNVAESLLASKFQIRAQIIWAKNNIVIGRGAYHFQHEPCWYCVRDGKPALFTEDRTQTTLFSEIDDVLEKKELVFLARDKAKKVYAIRGNTSCLWQIPKPQKSETGHSTQKPLECMARPMRNHQIYEVYDPFCGSGTTMVAAENLSRKCYGIEISPDYCAVILQRMVDAFGIKGEKING